MESESKGSELNLAIERVLKGPEVQLRDGMSFKDKAGHERHRARVKWWKPQSTDELVDYALEVKDENFTLSREDVSGIDSYPDKAKPLFFGHYWLDGDPGPLASNVACVDYSVAKDGKLCAYRWDGEEQIDAKKFVWVPTEV